MLISIISLIIFLFLTRGFITFRRFKINSKAPNYVETIKFWLSDFKNYKTYRIAKQKGASSSEEYELVTNYKSPNFQIAKEILEGNFSDYEQYLNAKVVGCRTKEEFDLVQNLEAPDYETAQDMQNEGFTSYKQFTESKTKNKFNNSADRQLNQHK